MIKVSVCMITYNHEKYIEQAIKSVLSQKTDFPIELIIGDDCSTDNTRKIIAKYKRKYSKKIFLVKRIKNIGMMNNFVDTLEKCKGKYITLCEGDDYWIDDSKLQKQVDFLENNVDCSLVFCRTAIKSDLEEVAYTPSINVSKNKFYIEDLLRSNFIATCSVMYRGNLIKNVPEWYKKLNFGDWPLHILYAQAGNIGYIRKTMAVYRKHDGGNFSSRMPYLNYKEIIKFLTLLKANIDHKHEKIINETIIANYEFFIINILQNNGNTNDFKDFLNSKSLRDVVFLKNHHPMVSVVLPVYNGEKYLRESIESILAQTATNFELIIINDGSRDSSKEIIQSFKDKRIRYFSQENIGLAATLNKGIKLSKGKYIARQDQDDISYPTRLEKQLNYLEKYKSCGLVGTRAEIWRENKPVNKSHNHPTDNLSIKFHLLFDNPFVHSSVMIRKEVFSKVGNYSVDELRQPPEDYELWSRISRHYRLANLPEKLQIYREVGTSMSRDKNNLFSSNIWMIAKENIKYLSNDISKNKDIDDFLLLTQGNLKSKLKVLKLNRINKLIRAIVRTIISKEKHIDSKDVDRLDAYSKQIFKKIRKRYFLSQFPFLAIISKIL